MMSNHDQSFWKTFKVLLQWWVADVRRSAVEFCLTNVQADDRLHFLIDDWRYGFGALFERSSTKIPLSQCFETDWVSWSYGMVSIIFRVDISHSFFSFYFWGRNIFPISWKLCIHWRNSSRNSRLLNSSKPNKNISQMFAFRER